MSHRARRPRALARPAAAFWTAALLLFTRAHAGTPSTPPAQPPAKPASTPAPAPAAQTAPATQKAAPGLDLGKLIQQADKDPDDAAVQKLILETLDKDEWTGLALARTQLDAPPHRSIMAAGLLAQRAGSETLIDTLEQLGGVSYPRTDKPKPPTPEEKKRLDVFTKRLRGAKSGDTNVGDERRLILRALAPAIRRESAKAGRATLTVPLTASEQRVYDLLALELGRGEPLLRACAARALADLGVTRALELLVPAISRVPSREDNWAGDRDGVLEYARLGATEALAARTFKDAQELRQWWSEHRAEITSTKPPSPGKAPSKSPATGAPKPVEPFRIEDKLAYTPRLVVDLSDWPGRSALTMNMLQMFDAAMNDAIAAAAPILGAVHPTLWRVNIVPREQMGKFGGSSQGAEGYTNGVRVVMPVPDTRLEDYKVTLTHECVHVLHRQAFHEQPRWLAEGLAESLTRSAGASSLAGAGQKIPEPLRADLLDRPVTRTLQWTSAPGSRESELNYARSMGVVDFLRFGPFTQPSVRLNALMGRLARGLSAPIALREVYGKTQEELDTMMLEWLKLK